MVYLRISQITTAVFMILGQLFVGFGTEDGTGVTRGEIAFDPVFRALKLGAPLSVQASSTRVNEETYPLGSMVTYHFPARSGHPEAESYGITPRIDFPPVKLIEVQVLGV